jgi:hypothetical protein
VAANPGEFEVPWSLSKRGEMGHLHALRKGRERAGGDKGGPDSDASGDTSKIDVRSINPSASSIEQLSLTRS